MCLGSRYNTPNVTRARMGLRLSPQHDVNRMGSGRLLVLTSLRHVSALSGLVSTWFSYAPGVLRLAMERWFALNPNFDPWSSCTLLNYFNAGYFNAGIAGSQPPDEKCRGK